MLLLFLLFTGGKGLKNLKSDVFGEHGPSYKNSTKSPFMLGKRDLLSDCENRQELDTDTMLISSSLFTANCMKHNRSGLYS